MTHDNVSDRTRLWASLGLMLGGALWGLYWIPVRAIGSIGLDGAWPGAVIYAAASLLMLPVIALRWRHIRNRWRALALCGLGTGAAFSLYSTSLLLTDVVRVILLFYLTPIWGTILGVMVLREALTLRRSLALICGLGGLLVVLGLGDGLPWPRNAGDWLALAAGMAWAYGSLKLYQMGSLAVADQILAFVIGALAVSAMTLAIGVPEFHGSGLDADRLRAVLPWAFLVGALSLPMLFLTVWPATLLTPGRVGLLLMTDAIVAVASAAAFAGEPFGWREGVGSALVVGAAVIEVAWRPHKA